MRIGLFGGSFDPPHLAHLIHAERCREEAQLDEVWFLPAYRPPHKLDKPISRFETRCEMVELAVAGSPHFRVERIERELPPPSYTIETLRELRQRHPGHAFDLVIGGDSLRDFPTWHEPARILEQAGLIVVARPDINLISDHELALMVNVPVETVRLTIVHSPLLELSSSNLRDRSRAGRTIRYLTPRAVEEYIREKGIYAEHCTTIRPARA